MKETAEVGVLVGRYQVDELHPGQVSLISKVVKQHQKVLLFLGLSPVRVTRNNPLDFEARKQMILNEWPDINVLYIKDTSSDEAWSKRLDQQISDLVGPLATVMLYGGRESFIDHYTGTYTTEEVEEVEFTSGTAVRKRLGGCIKKHSFFRAGVIWAAFNGRPTTYPTVDVAIWNEARTRLLMARKSDETKYQFIGGFVDPNETLEAACRREVQEEAHISITDPVYVGSCPVDDWRYRREVDGIVTSFFETHLQMGRPAPDDDIEELKWIDAGDFSAVKAARSIIVGAHIPLWEMLFRSK